MASQSISLFWFKPIKTTRSLFEKGQGHGWALAIASLFGLVQSLPLYLADESRSFLILLYGAMVGAVALYVFGLLFRISGRLFKSDPKPVEIRTSIGLGLLPWTLLFGLLFALTQSGQDGAAIAGYYPVFFLLFFYGYTVILLSLSVALQLSLWKTFFCIAITFIGSLFPLTLIAQLFMTAPAVAG